MIHILIKCPSCGAVHNPAANIALPPEVCFSGGAIDLEEPASATAVTYYCDTCGEAFLVDSVAKAP